MKLEMIKKLLFLSLIMLNKYNIYSQDKDSISNTSNHSSLNHSIGFYLGTSPITYGGMVGIDYKYKNASFELNYYGYNMFYFLVSLNPILYFGNSFSKVSLSSNLLFTSKKRPKKSFSCGITFIHVWDNYDINSQYDVLYGINGYNAYPSIGYYNEKMAKSIFNFKVKLGIVPVFPNTNRVNYFQFLPVLDINVGVNLLKK